MFPEHQVAGKTQHEGVEARSGRAAGAGGIRAERAGLQGGGVQPGAGGRSLRASKTDADINAALGMCQRKAEQRQHKKWKGTADSFHVQKSPSYQKSTSQIFLGPST